MNTQARSLVIDCYPSTPPSALRQGYTWMFDEQSRHWAKIPPQAASATRPLCSDGPFLLAAPRFGCDRGGHVVFEVIFLVAVTLVLRRGNPEARLSIVEGLVLVREVDALLVAAGGTLATLGEGAGTGGQLGAHGSVLYDPVGEGVLAVLNDTGMMLAVAGFIWVIDVRLASLVAIICVPSLSRRDGGVVDELEKVLSVASNDSQLLTMLAHSIELVVESSLELLACDVGELGLGDQRLGLGANEFLLENNDPRRVRLLVL